MSVIAKVNGFEIDDKMLESATTRYIIQMEEEDEEEGFEPTEQNLKFIKTESLNYLIERMLLVQLAGKKGFKAAESEVAERVNELRSEYDDDEEWKTNLLQLRVTESGLRDELREDILIEKMLDIAYAEEASFTENDLKNYYEENKRLMREPDYYTFYEVVLDKPENLKLVGGIIESSKDIDRIKDGIAALGLELIDYVNVQSGRLPEEVYNVLTDLEPGKMGTMMLDDTTVVLYKLLKRTTGKELKYVDIKEDLRDYLVENARQEIYYRIVDEEMDKADIVYVDVSMIEKK